MANENRIFGGDSRTADKFVVRLEEGMRARVGAMSKAQHRSMNSYMLRAIQTALQIDEEAAGTYVAPEVEVVPSVVMETRPQWLPGMACRHEGKIWIIQSMPIHAFGNWVEAILRDHTGYCREARLDDLEPY